MSLSLPFSSSKEVRRALGWKFSVLKVRPRLSLRRNSFFASLVCSLRTSLTKLRTYSRGDLKCSGHSLNAFGSVQPSSSSSISSGSDYIAHRPSFSTQDSCSLILESGVSRFIRISKNYSISSFVRLFFWLSRNFLTSFICSGQKLFSTIIWKALRSL